MKAAMRTMEFTEQWDDEGEVTQVEIGDRASRSDTFVIVRPGAFHGLSDAATVMLAQIEDGV